MGIVVSYRSSTRRGDFERDTHGNIVVSASRCEGG
jgi:hypothetical protein